MKKTTCTLAISLAFSVLLISPINAFWPFQQQTEKPNPTNNHERLQNYIGHIIDSLFDAPSMDHLGRQQLTECKALAEYTITHSGIELFKGNSINADLIEQMTISQALEFINSKVYVTVLLVIYRLDIPHSQIDEHTAALTISKTIYEQAQNAAIQASQLHGIFAPYFGQSLTALIYPMVKEYVRAHQHSSIPTTIYDLNDPACNTCFEDFDTNDHKRIFLACGHSLCISCTRTLSKYTKNCPICRRETVDLKKLADQL